MEQRFPKDRLQRACEELVEGFWKSIGLFVLSEEVIQACDEVLGGIVL
jgi:hypothetical protein